MSIPEDGTPGVDASQPTLIEENFRSDRQDVRDIRRRKMNRTNIPGFAAEASLYNEGALYRAHAQAAVGDGLVQSALSDRIDLWGRRAWCLIENCVYIPPYGTPLCWRTIGIRNPVTGRCE